VLKFAFTDVPATQREWWIVVKDGEVDVCDVDPGFDVTATVEARLRALTLVWRGDVGWREVQRSGELRIVAASAVAAAVPRWLKLSTMAATQRPSQRASASAAAALG
jgi:hypothetical protein